MTDFSSSDSADYSIQTCSESKATIFLTFDDGIEAGTAEIYELLQQKKVPATFFCVGENVFHNDKSGLFQKMYHDPTMMIGNHSMTHGHQFYESFYGEKEGWLYGFNDASDAINGRKGLRINADTGFPDANAKHTATRRSVLMDFEYANRIFSNTLMQMSTPYPDYPADYIGKIDVTMLTYSRFLTARMPGTNTWLLDGIIDHKSDTRDEEGNDLMKNEYRIYGWDYEWKMEFEVKEEQKPAYRKGRDGFLDLYSDQYINISIWIDQLNRQPMFLRK